MRTTNDTTIRIAMFLLALFPLLGGDVEMKWPPCRKKT